MINNKQWCDKFYYKELSYLDFSYDKLISRCENVIIEIDKNIINAGKANWLTTSQKDLWTYLLEKAKREKPKQMKDNVNHPSHYGGKDNVYEAINVIEAHGLSFALGNAVKYILRAGKKGDKAEDLKKAAWYIERELHNL